MGKLTQKDGAEKTPRFNWVKFGFLGTIVWAIFLGLVIYFERLPGLFTIAENQSLQLNTFGDFLAGIFAPLAFLWLFVATMVQSQELALQREELQLTRQEFVLSRGVASQQADEAKQQATHLGKQTEIIVRADADRNLNAVLDSLRALLLQSFRNHLAVTEVPGFNPTQVRPLGTQDTLYPIETLHGLVTGVRATTQGVRAALKARPNAKVYNIAAPGSIQSLREIVDGIKTLLPSISPGQAAILAAANFSIFMQDADFLLEVCHEAVA